MIDPIILIVEDDAALLASLAWSFEVEGFRVRPYQDSESLLAEDALPERGCMIIDYRLPALNGLELVGRLRDRGCLLPALLITTPAPGVVREARAAGIPLVEKPLVGGTLLTEVRSLLN
jgi:FixJ family two-component response regulator